MLKIPAGALLVGQFPCKNVTAQDSCDMRDRLLRYFATCCQEKPLSGSLKEVKKRLKTGEFA